MNGWLLTEKPHITDWYLPEMLKFRNTCPRAGYDLSVHYICLGFLSPLRFFKLFGFSLNVLDKRLFQISMFLFLQYDTARKIAESDNQHQKRNRLYTLTICQYPDVLLLALICWFIQSRFVCRNLCRLVQYVLNGIVQ